ncbi:MAG: hypothetical protein M3093_02955 [Thermoproteota archaeon]|nr:hypothetical protein [Thermoproteota archaeon]
MADQQQQQRCAICGSRFAERKCYFCQSRICSSCTVPTDITGYTIKCISCDRKKIVKLGLFTLLKRNYYLIGILVAFWLFTVFPLPFLHLAGIEVDPSAFQPVLIATAVMTIPFIFMFMAWQKRAPRGSQ